jgi:hypothetical protein
MLTPSLTHTSSKGRDASSQYPIFHYENVLRSSNTTKICNPLAYLGDEEVVFQDIQDLDTARSLAGFSKIQGSCHIAREHQYEWIWIDTCCIDKSSSAELTEAINSMYSYYRKASWCIAFLEDVPPKSQIDKPGKHDIMNAFRNSYWFTRGWMLQELIAPIRLSFYAQDWTILGTEFEFLDDLAAITSINGSILLDSGKIQEECIARKMSWASKRNTTREEDEAYCLMGIFDVNIPLLYGEGGVKAFVRL